MAGSTGSTDFPGTTGGAQAANGGGLGDAFVARLNSTLTTLAQATYLGGSGFDGAVALAIHPTSGDVYVAGDTNSTDFPGTTGGTQAAKGGVDDAFVARLTSGLVLVEPRPTPTATNVPTKTPTSTPTNPPPPVPVVPMLNGRGILILGLLVAGAGLLLLIRGT